MGFWADTAKENARSEVIHFMLESKSHSKLYLAGRVGLSGDHAKRRNAEVRVGPAKNRRIGQVERLGAYLEQNTLGELEILK
jgi:hypothetical protein